MQADVSKDLAAVVASIPPPISDTALWQDTVAMSRDEHIRKPAGRMRIARMMEVALIHAGVEPDDVPLDVLSYDDVAAMREVAGFPDKEDILLYLLMRGPSLRDEFESEGYTAKRLVLEGMSYRILAERADRDYLGVGTDFDIAFIDASDDPVAVAPGERAKTRRLKLAALPAIVLAAKAFRASERAPEGHAIFPPYGGCGSGKSSVLGLFRRLCSGRPFCRNEGMVRASGLCGR